MTWCAILMRARQSLACTCANTEYTTQVRDNFELLNPFLNKTQKNHGHVNKTIFASEVC